MHVIVLGASSLGSSPVLWVTLWWNFIIFSSPSIIYGAFEEINLRETLSLNFSFQPRLPLIFPVQESGLQVCVEGSFNSWAVPSDRASFILNAGVSRRHGSCYEMKQGKKILIRVPSPGFRARINRARHEIIEISLIQKNAISQHLKGITSLKINILPLIFWINLQKTCINELAWVKRDD